MGNSKSFTDSRGTIRDLLVTSDYSVSHITFTPGAVRGNHYHEKTTQYDFLLKGSLDFVVGNHSGVMFPARTIKIEPNEPHAYKALEPSEMLTICFGVRKGEDYEKDVIRLKKPLLK